MTIKVGMISLGCSKNQVDAERLLAMLAGDGFTICNDMTECDAVIVNTCGFIEDAKKESIDTILECCAAKGEGSLKCVAVTGCLAERYREELAREIPEADVVLGIGSNGKIGEAIRKAVMGEHFTEYGEKESLSMEGERMLANEPWFAYVKVAEGCDNRCSYCAIPLIRGRFRSRPMENVIEECKELAARGVTELNLVAQDTTRYGEDLNGKLLLPQLLRDLNELEGIKWIRVMYLYPNNFTDDLIAAFAECDKVCKYIDIPLQHASDRLLDSMNRYDTRAQVEELLAKLRERIPGITIRTTFIVGFPGETDEDFAELMDFVEKQRFENAGVFQYSQEEGTVAGAMENQIEPEVKENRYHELMALQAGISEEIHQEREDEELDVIVEGFDEENPALAVGRSYHEAPDIDGNIFIENAAELEVGQMVRVRILQGFTYEMVAELV